MIELMVALVLFSFVTVGMLTSAVTMLRGFREQEATISTETSTRSSIDFLADALRQASPGIQLSSNITHVSTCAIGAFSVLNNQATPLGSTADELTMVFASGAVVTSLRTTYTKGDATITVANATDLTAGDTVLITNFDTGHLVKIGSIAGTTLTLASACGALPNHSPYASGTLVVRAVRATFRVRTQDGIPVLMMDPDAEGTLVEEPIAENIESMEIALGIDANNDGVLTEVGAVANDDEWILNRTGEIVPALFTNLRAVRITLIARSPRQFQGVNSFILPAIEDRAANGATDNFRRRILSTTVEVRNLGGSP